MSQIVIHFLILWRFALLSNQNRFILWRRSVVNILVSKAWNSSLHSPFFILNFSLNYKISIFIPKALLSKLHSNFPAALYIFNINNPSEVNSCLAHYQVVCSHWQGVILEVILVLVFKHQVHSSNRRHFNSNSFKRTLDRLLPISLEVLSFCVNSANRRMVRNSFWNESVIGIHVELKCLP